MGNPGHFTTSYNGKTIRNIWSYCQEGPGLQVQEATLHPGETLVIGRIGQKTLSLGDWARDGNTDKGASTWCFDDPRISATHLKIYSVASTNKACIPPLVLVEDLSSGGTLLLPGGVARQSRVMSSARGAVVLKDGDHLRLSASVTLVWHQSQHTRRGLEHLLAPDEIVEVRHFKSHFQVWPSQLDHHACGTVLLATNALTGRQLACKLVNIPSADVQASRTKTRSAAEEVMREADILRTLCHPNVVRLEKVHYTDYSVYVLQELLAGGSLVDHIVESGGKLNNAVGMLIAKQILEGLKHCHDQEIVHRDVKAENILLSSRARCPRAVLANFGNAAKLPGRFESLQSLGCYSLADAYGYGSLYLPYQNRDWVKTAASAKAADMWAFGCLVYQMLVGKHPFSCSDTSPATKTNTSMPPPPSIWANVKVESHAKDFIDKLLTTDTKKRLTVEEALHHSWFTDPSIKATVEEAYRNAAATCHSPYPYPNLIEPIVIPKGVKYLGQCVAGKCLAGRSLRARGDFLAVPPKVPNLLRNGDCCRKSRQYHPQRRAALLNAIPQGSRWADPALFSLRSAAPTRTPTATPRLTPVRYLEEPDRLALPPPLIDKGSSPRKRPRETSEVGSSGVQDEQVPWKRSRLN